MGFLLRSLVYQWSWVVVLHTVENVLSQNNTSPLTNHPSPLLRFVRRMRPGSALEGDLKVVRRHLPALNYLGKKGHTVSMDEPGGGRRKEGGINL